MRRVRLHLFIAFAFTVMADPVSSVAYAIEAALRALDGDPAGLFAAMGLVVAVIVVVSLTYHQLIGRFPEGGGGPEAVARAFGEGWAFLPLGALLVDFTLTVAVSCAAGASALIAFAPALAGARTAIAVALALAVAGGVLVGHRGRVGFAIATQAFLLMAVAVIVAGLLAEPGAATASGTASAAGPPRSPMSRWARRCSFSRSACPSRPASRRPPTRSRSCRSWRDRGRRRFGRGTLWLMVAIVGPLTLAIAGLTVRLHIGLPDADSTLLADVARRSLRRAGSIRRLPDPERAAAARRRGLLVPGGLRSAEGAGYDRRRRRAGPPARAPAPENRHLISHWGVVLVLVLAGAMLVAARGDEQALVRFYAVSVFASFLAATLACARLSHRDGNRGAHGGEPARLGVWWRGAGDQPDPPRLGDRPARLALRRRLPLAGLGRKGRRVSG